MAADDNKEEPVVDVDDNAAAAKTEENDPEKGDSNSPAMTIPKMELSEAQVPLAGVFVSSVILLVAFAEDGKGVKNYEYGIALSTISMFFSLVAAVMLVMNKSAQTTQIISYINYFLVLWNFIGACVVTFNGPYIVTSNGYFAAWGAAVFSVMAAGCSFDEMQSVVQGMGSVVALGAAASVVLIAVADRGISGSFREYLLYSIILAPITLIVVASLYAQSKGDKPYMGGMMQFLVMASLAVCWIVQAGLVTFRGPFRVTSNGYFGSWGAAFAATMAAMESYPGSASSSEE